MATAAQIDANRLNSQKSTGPRSDEGKAASKFNALKHGIDAVSSVLPTEDLAEREALVSGYVARFQPSTPEEVFLLNTMIEADWNRRRYQTIETDMMNRILATQFGQTGHRMAKLFDHEMPFTPLLERVIRHREAAERAWHRAYKQMLQEIAARPLPASQPRTGTANSPEPTQFHPPLPTLPRPEMPENLALRL